MSRFCGVLFCCALALAWNSGAAERINHEGRILGTTPTVSTPTLFNTSAADTVVSTLQIYPTTNPWNEDISKRLPLGNSNAMIAQIKSDIVGKGNGTVLRAFFEMNYVLIPDSQPKVPVRFKLYADESDDVDQSTIFEGADGKEGIGSYPIPTILPVEGFPVETGNLTNEQWERDTGGGDRHSTMVMPGAGMIWEMGNTLLTNNSPVWEGSTGCKFNLTTGALRQDRLTSGDAAGFALFPALVRFDECERGVIEHAMRLVVVHSRQQHIYPATHDASSPPVTDANFPAMGERFRLKSLFVVPDNWTKQEKAVCAAFKKYGGMVADNGSFFSFSVCPDDRFPSGCFDHLKTIDVSNFEAIQTTGVTEGPRSAGAPTVTAVDDFTLDPTVTANLSATITGTSTTVQWYVYPFTTPPGTVAFGTPAANTTTATFSAVGTYTLMVKVSDGIHTPVYDAVIVTVQAGGGTGPAPGDPSTGGGGPGGGSAGLGTGPNDDFDGDGVINSADDDADNDGTPNASDSAPYDFFVGGSATAMTIKTLKGSVKFLKPDTDAVSIQGTLPKLPAKIDLNTKNLTIDVGGAVLTFPLDAKGKGKSLQGTAAISLKPSKRNKTTKLVEFLGGDVTFKIAMKKGTWSDDWIDEGITTALDTKEIKSAPIPFVVTLNLGGKPYTATVTTTYKGKVGVSGTYSYKMPKP